jgi:Tol biopolymer transport system component
VWGRPAGVLLAVLSLAAVGLYAIPREGPPPSPTRLGVVARIAPVTTLPGDEHAPALSPDGAFVAFAWDHGDGYANIHVKAVTGSEAPVRLTTERSRHSDPAWSPDGSRIAFLRQLAPAEFEILVAPVLADSRGRQVAEASMRLISREGSPRLGWSPDGEHLLFSTYATSEAEAAVSTLIHALALRTGEVTVVTRGERVFDTSPAVAPDGARIAFTRFELSERLPVLMVQPLAADLTTVGEPIPVPGVPPGLVHSPSWSPDGRALTFVVGQQIFEWPVDSTARPVYTSGAPVGSLSVAWKHGRPIAVASASDTDGDIWVLPIDPVTHAAVASAIPRLRSTELEQHPRFSPDGSQFAFVSRRSGGEFAIWLADANGRNPREITNIGAQVTGFPNWSPDGGRIAFHASFPSRPRQVFIVDLAAGTTKPIGEGATPSWSPDGEYVYVGEVGRSPATATTVTPIRAGDCARERLFIGDLPTVTRDGTHLLYAQVREFGIWRRSLDGDVASNAEEKLVDDYTPTLGGIFALDDGFIYPSHTPEGVPRAFRFYDYATGEVRDIAPAPASLALGLTVSADGRELLYAAGASESGADLLLLEFD